MDFVREVAAQHQATPAQIALAWVMQQKPFIVPIPGSSKEKHLADNLGATDIVFSETELHTIHKQLSAIKIYGDRYSPENQKNVDR